MMRVAQLRDLQLSPEGDEALIERSVPRDLAEFNSYRTVIYRSQLDGKAPEPFTSTNCSSWSARYSPDGRWVAFISNRSGLPQLYLAERFGRRVVQLTSLKWGVEGYLWSPSSRQIAVATLEQGMVLWRVDLSGQMQPLTRPEEPLEWRGERLQFDWSPAGEELTYLSSNLSLVTVASSGRWRKRPGMGCSTPRYSPDGRWIALLKEEDEESQRAALLSRESGDLHLLARTSNGGPSSIFPALFAWRADSSALILSEPQGFRDHIVAIPIDGGAPIELDDGATYFRQLSLNSTGSHFGLVVEAPDQLPEAYFTPVDRFTPCSISCFNRWAEGIPMAKTVRVEWEAPDGESIEGLLTLPIGYEPGEQCPLLLVIHGGPASRFGAWSIATPYPYPVAAFADAGYAVLRANPRGSTGYGVDFRRAVLGDWGGVDASDLMAGVDLLIERGIADPERLGVMGWSYGGYLAAWTISQTDRFRAASVGAGISNFLTMIETTDLPSLFFVPEEGRELFYRERSPISYADSIKTPALILHGRSDERVPVDQSLELFRALKRSGCEVDLFLYSDAGHALVMPRDSLDAMNRNLEWFLFHLPPKTPEPL